MYILSLERGFVKKVIMMDDKGLKEATGQKSKYFFLLYSQLQNQQGNAKIQKEQETTLKKWNKTTYG